MFSAFCSQTKPGLGHGAGHHFHSTTELLNSTRKSTTTCSFPFGRQGFPGLLDLCAAQRVTTFLYLVPGLRLRSPGLRPQAAQGCEVLYYPPLVDHCGSEYGVYSSVNRADGQLKRLHAQRHLQRPDKFGHRPRGDGHQKSDSEFRRKNVAAFQRPNVLCPLRGGTSSKSFPYLAMHKIVPQIDRQAGRRHRPRGACSAGSTTTIQTTLRNCGVVSVRRRCNRKTAILRGEVMAKTKRRNPRSPYRRRCKSRGGDLPPS